jgi:hypothetical protein
MKRLIAAFAVALMAVFSVAPAQAAKPFAGSYKVTLAPDPSPNAFVLIGEESCFTVSPFAVDKRNLSVPSAGKLRVTLDSPDPTGQGVADWDLYVLDSDGEILDSSHGATSHEETVTKLKRKTNVTVAVCNLAGAPEGTVTYKLTK